jgi:hypothetical protein
VSSRIALGRLSGLVWVLLALSMTALAAPATPAAQPCRLLSMPASVPVAAPVGLSPCSGVRPGAPVTTDSGLCSLNFMFQGSDGDRYMGTAGHCVLLDETTGPLDFGNLPAKEEVYPRGAGPEARDAGGARIGEFAYAILADPKDFALIRLDKGVSANPQMCHFGGPTGINADQPALEEPVLL